MIVIGTDTHKRTHTCGAVFAGTGQLAGELTAPAREFLAKKQAEGKTRIEALRCLKRHLARRVWKLLVNSEREISMNTVDTQRGKLTPQFGVAA